MPNRSSKIAASRPFMLLFSLIFSGCDTASAPAPIAPKPVPKPVPAPKQAQPSKPAPPPPLTWPLEIRLQPLQGASLSGLVRLSPAPSGAAVHVEVQDTGPARLAAHIHSHADCSDVTGGSAGPHFAPEGQVHGLVDSANHHRGDLGNIKLDAQGEGTLDLEIARVSLEREGPTSLLGRALVVRSAADDGLHPDPGQPLACARLLP